MASSLVLPSELVAAEKENALFGLQVEEQLLLGKIWERELKQLDPYLSLLLAKDSATHPSLAPGCWHIRKKIPGGTDEYWPLVGDHGEYREPGPWILDELKDRDLWNPAVHRSIKEVKEKRRQAKVRANKLKIEQRGDHLREDVRAIFRLRGESQLTTTTAFKRAGKGLTGYRR